MEHSPFTALALPRPTHSGLQRSGLQDVYLWWTDHETRQTAVPVRIYDNGTLLATVYVNQKLNGGKWNYIGSYTFSGLAQVRIASTSTTLSTCADAARFVPVVQQPTPPSITSTPITIGEVGTPYAYDVQAVGDPVLLYELTSAPGGMTIDPATGVISWTPTAVGSFNVTVRVSNSFGDDTQSFTIVVTDPASEVIIDDGQPGTTAVGAWSVSYGTGPYGTQSLYSFSTTATYTFGIERSGLQDVYLWWTEHETRQTAVPVRIYDNGTLLATVYVNQKLNGGKWNYIGSYTFSGLAQVRIASTSTT